MKLRSILIKGLIAGVFGLWACNGKHANGATEDNAGNEPSQTEIYKFFDKQLGQTAKAGGYVNYKVKIDRYQYAQPKQITLPDAGTVTTYPVKIDRTEYLTGFHHTYVSIYKNDAYRLYRDDKGNLVALEHTAGQTSTVQRPASNF